MKKLDPLLLEVPISSPIRGNMQALIRGGDDPLDVGCPAVLGTPVLSGFLHAWRFLSTKFFCAVLPLVPSLPNSSIDTYFKFIFVALSLSIRSLNSALSSVTQGGGIFDKNHVI
uniref:Uncharacterized protein n=1 Tax=Physcomitrium patens TaxID=3218 RepID=A0A2K1LBD6_PHYPA|nr:hypothetical protein PHYPA_001763 [Physcomitrium patens]